MSAPPLEQRHKPATLSAAVSSLCCLLPHIPQLWQLPGLPGKVGLPAPGLVDQE